MKRELYVRDILKIYLFLFISKLDIPIVEQHLEEWF